jgi:cytochrome P450
VTTGLSDFEFQHAPNKPAIYRDGPGIWFSEEIRRWMVTSPDLIRQVMTNRAFSVPSYKTGKLGSRMGQDFSKLDLVTQYLPLAYEGEEHKRLRAQFARLITRNTPAALLAFSQALETCLDACRARPEFCLIQDLLLPAMRPALCKLAGIDAGREVRVEDVPQLFDDAISGKRRMAIQAIIEQLTAASTFSDPEDTHIGIALMAVSSNTLLGSLSRSCIAQLEAGNGKSLQKIEWSEDFSHTALALIEKVALTDTELGAVKLKAGDRIRLFLDAAGYEHGGNESTYSDLFFAVGPHRCVGMSISRQIWGLLTARLAQEKMTLRIKEVTHRQGDYVFIFPNRCLVENSPAIASL